MFGIVVITALKQLDKGNGNMGTFSISTGELTHRSPVAYYNHIKSLSASMLTSASLARIFSPNAKGTVISMASLNKKHVLHTPPWKKVALFAINQQGYLDFINLRNHAKGMQRSTRGKLMNWKVTNKENCDTKLTAQNSQFFFSMNNGTSVFYRL